MSGSHDFAQHYADVFAPLGTIEVRRFFGGWGLHQEGKLFAVVMDTLYFRVDSSLRGTLAERGAVPFVYRARERRVVVERFYSTPPVSIDDPEALCELAGRILLQSDA